MTYGIYGYRCSECGLILGLSECIRCDDPMAPLGPEWLCHHCESLAHPWMPLWVLVLAISLAILLGGGFAILLRW